MLFFLEQEVADHFDSGGATLFDAGCLDCLALGAADGYHRIVGSRRTLLRLAGTSTLHWKTQKVLERAAGRIAQEGGLLRNLTVYGRVLANIAEPPVSTSVGGQRIVTFPLRWFDASAKVQPTVILGENLLDAFVLQKIAEAGTILANLGHIPLSSCPDHGGGSSTGMVLGLNAASNRPCVCVVDSDRACPAGTLGGTATAVQPFKNIALHPLVEVSEIGGRDLENLLPDAFYRSVYGNRPTHGGLVSILEHLTGSNEIDLRAHIDIEKGVLLHQVFNYPSGSREDSFWRSKLPILMAHFGFSTSTFSCLATGFCAQRAVGNTCTCVIVTGNEADILRAFLAQFGSATRYQLATSLDGSVRGEWQRVGVMVASWCCADERLRV